MTNSFFDEKVLKVDYSRLNNMMDKKYVKKSLSVLQSEYNVNENDSLSLTDVKSIFLNLLSKIRPETREDYDDKYKQKGFFKLYNTLKKLFLRIWNRAWSIVTSTSASVAVFIIGLTTLQSLMAAIVLCTIYTTITLSIKSYQASKLGTSMAYEPGEVGFLSLDNIVNFIKYVFTFIKDTFLDVVNWFFFKIESNNEKDPEVYLRRRRFFLLFIILVFIVILV